MSPAALLFPRWFFFHLPLCEAYFMYIIGLGFHILPNIKCTFSFLLWFMFIALPALLYVHSVLMECVVQEKRCYIPFLASLVLFSSPIFIKLQFNLIHFFILQSSSYLLDFPSVAFKTTSVSKQ